MNLLVVKANNRPDGVSTEMYKTFIEAANEIESLNVTTYDLYNEDLPYLGQDLFSAFGKLQSGEELTEVEQRILAAKQKAMDAFAAADVLVFAFPLWNLTIPAVLQTFVDYVYAAGFTFKYNADGSMDQLMKDKKVVLLNASGGVYSIPETEGMEMSVNYMRNVFGNVFGMEIIGEVIIEGHNAMLDKAQEIIQEGLRQVTEVASKLTYQQHA
ncbi:FMN-dependent NADH-azoreductase [Peribacillus asahii]|uniref:FMN-dependent NADH-azoreductase n=1 Tax=Peribacillus asahii TaxID=228899 RepID=UPI0037F38E7F